MRATAVGRQLLVLRGDERIDVDAPESRHRSGFHWQKIGARPGPRSRTDGRSYIRVNDVKYGSRVTMLVLVCYLLSEKVCRKLFQRLTRPFFLLFLHFFLCYCTLWIICKLNNLTGQSNLRADKSLTVKKFAEMEF